MDLIPMIIKRSEKGERSYDLFSYLLSNRIVFLYGPITDGTSGIVCAQLIFLASLSKEPIQMYICSPGGHLHATMAMIDTMHYIKPEIHTWALGIAGSAASVMLTCGTKGHRNIFPNAQVMLHEPSGGYIGRSVHIADHADAIMKIRNQLVNIYCEQTGQTSEKINELLNRETFLNAEQALKLGLVDRIVSSDIEVNAP